MPALSLSRGGMGKRARKAKVTKLVGLNKDSLLGETKIHMQAKEKIHYFPSAARCSAISKEAGLHHV